MAVIIGIDPGVNCGFAAYFKNIKSLRGETLPPYWYFETHTFWGVVREIEGLITAGDFGLLEVYIENPNENKPVFQKRGADNVKKILKVAQNVGSNKRDAQLLIEYFELNKIKYHAVKPTAAKWTQQGFEYYTGQKVKVSQHVRDAARLIVGR